MKGFGNKHQIIISVLILSTITTPFNCEEDSYNKITKKDVIDVVFEKHAAIARCRLFCFQELMGPRLLYQNIDSISYECKNTSISCHHCYEMCEKIMNNKEDEMTVCNYNNHMCFGGCRTACKYKWVSNHNIYQPNILEENEKDVPEILAKDCVLYWHFHSRKLSETNLVMYQIYGQDVSNTWFDLGQTTKSYFEHLPSILGKCKTILIISIDEYTSTELEYNLDKAFVKDTCNVNNGTQHSYIQDIINIKPLFHSSLENTAQASSDSTLKICIILGMCLFVLLLILLCVVVYRIKRKRDDGKLNSTCGTVQTENTYEEIDIRKPDNTYYSQVTSIKNNTFPETALMVSLPPEEYLNKPTKEQNICYHYDDNIHRLQDESTNINVENPGTDFVDVVSWLRTVNSEMRFDTFGANIKERRSNINLYPINYFHVEMSPKQ